MRKLFNSIFFILLFLYFLWIFKIYASDTVERFDTVKLRYWYSYTFSDYFEAISHKVWIYSYNGSTFDEKYDYNGWTNPSWDYTQDLKDSDFLINIWERKKAFESKSPYEISYYPPTREDDNLIITYVTRYYFQDNWKWYGNPDTHTEIQPYTITRCWDWIKDNYYESFNNITINEECDDWNTDNNDECKNDCTINTSYTYCWDWTRNWSEECDYNDTSKTWWWDWWCSNTCSAIDLRCTNLMKNKTKINLWGSRDL